MQCVLGSIVTPLEVGPPCWSLMRCRCKVAKQQMQVPRHDPGGPLKSFFRLRTDANIPTCSLSRFPYSPDSGRMVAYSEITLLTTVVLPVAQVVISGRAVNRQQLSFSARFVPCTATCAQSKPLPTRLVKAKCRRRTLDWSPSNERCPSSKMGVSELCTCRFGSWQAGS